MNLSGENLKLILGFKLKRFRHNAQLSLQELAQKTNLSPSYISEIEQGKKYPKPEKIIVLSQALNRTFDEMVSLNLEDDQNPLSEILKSPILNEFPWEQFGISIREIVRLVSDDFGKAGALIQTLHEIGTNYDMRVEHFLLATLRSLQIIHMNYFEELEEAAEKFREEYREQFKEKPINAVFETILTEEYHYEIDFDCLHQHPELYGLRSVWINSDPKKLLINRNLVTSQKNFILSKEIGYLRMNLKERAIASSWIQTATFEQIYNNFKASYFAGAVLLEQGKLIKDLKTFFKQPKWNASLFVELMKKYEATPEMFLHRLSELLPKFFNLKKLHYMLFDYQSESGIFHLAKTLNTTNVFIPRGNDQTEHHCRRWVSIRSLSNVKDAQNLGGDETKRVFVQRSRFIASDQEFFNISVVYPSHTLKNSLFSITLGILINDEFKEQVHYWNDAQIARVDVNETCERCPLNEDQCSERVAPPVLFEASKRQEQRREALNSLRQEMSG